MAGVKALLSRLLPNPTSIVQEATGSAILAASNCHIMDRYRVNKMILQLTARNRAGCFGCLKGGSTSVQVLSSGIETVLVLTLIRSPSSSILGSKDLKAVTVRML